MGGNELTRGHNCSLGSHPDAEHSQPKTGPRRCMSHLSQLNAQLRLILIPVIHQQEEVMRANDIYTLVVKALCQYWAVWVDMSFFSGQGRGAQGYEFQASRDWSSSHPGAGVPVIKGQELQSSRGLESQSSWMTSSSHPGIWVPVIQGTGILVIMEHEYQSSWDRSSSHQGTGVPLINRQAFQSSSSL